MNTTGPAAEISNAFLRAGLYRTLAQAFGYPDQDMLAALKKYWNTQLQQWQQDWPAGVRAILAAALHDLQNVSLPDLAEAHVRLFGPAAHCPLTETSWGDSARLLGRPAQIADISGFYRAFGLQPAAAPDALPEDHLVNELEFLSILCIKEAYALYAGLDEQLSITRDACNTFLEEHLATWIDYWIAQMEVENPPSFYGQLAKILQYLVHAECARLGLRPQTLRGRATDTEVGDDTLDCPLSAKPQ